MVFRVHVFFCLLITASYSYSMSPALQRDFDEARIQLSEAPWVDDALRTRTLDVVKRLKAGGRETDAASLSAALNKMWEARAEMAPQKKEKAEAQKVESLEEEKLYKITLPNGEDLKFSQSEIEHSDLLATALKKDDEFPIQNSPTTINITKIRSSNPDEVSLADLKKILSILSRDKSQPLIIENASFNRLIELYKVAIYFDIRPLENESARRIDALLLKQGDSKEFRDSIRALPSTWQKKLNVYLLSGGINNFLLDHMTQLFTNYFNGFVFDISWSPDGNKIGLVANNYAQAWKVQPKKMINSFLGTTVHERINSPHRPPHKVAWSPDSSRLAFDDGLVIWIEILPREDRLLTVGKGLETFAWSTKGNFIASVTVNNGVSQIQIWDAQMYAVNVTLPDQKEVIKSIVWLSNDTLATVSDKGHIVFWAVATSTITHEFPALSSDEIHHIVWSTDRTKIAYCSDSKMILRDAKTGAQVGMLEYAGDIKALAWSPDGNYLAAGTNEKSIVVWDLRQQMIAMVLRVDAAPIISMSWSPDGKRLAFGTPAGSAIWDIEPGLFKLDLMQVELIEKIISVKPSLWQRIAGNKYLLSSEDVAIYNSLPKEWKELLAKAKITVVAPK